MRTSDYSLGRLSLNQLSGLWPDHGHGMKKKFWQTSDQEVWIVNGLRLIFMIST